MSTLAVELHPQAQNIICTDEAIIVELVDGRIISAPLAWIPLLLQATQEQRDNCKVMAMGFTGLILMRILVFKVYYPGLI